MQKQLLPERSLSYLQVSQIIHGRKFLFTLNGVNYIVVVDYFSRYPDVIKLSSTTSSSIVSALKSIFSRHGVPQVLVSDNGPQYASQEFASFARQYGFSHITSRPHFPQSNGQAERTVQTVKRLLHNSEDPYMALLCYWATPLPWCETSPSELLMGRRLRSNLPIREEELRPKWPDLENFRYRDKAFKQKQDHDHRHRATPLPPIPNDTEVWVTTDGRETPGKVIAPSDTPISYLVLLAKYGETDTSSMLFPNQPGSTSTCRGISNST